MTFEQKVRSLITQIPPGRVTTYGQIAALAGSPRAARAVGMILRNDSTELPWQRVINSRGRISILNFNYPAQLQAELLRQEGVAVTESREGFFVDLSVYLWKT